MPGKAQPVATPVSIAESNPTGAKPCAWTASPLMVDAPSTVSEAQLKELHIRPVLRS
jgi:hypothetical protein